MKRLFALSGHRRPPIDRECCDELGEIAQQGGENRGHNLESRKRGRGDGEDSPDPGQFVVAESPVPGGHTLVRYVPSTPTPAAEEFEGDGGKKQKVDGLSADQVAEGMLVSLETQETREVVEQVFHRSLNRDTRRGVPQIPKEKIDPKDDLLVELARLQMSDQNLL